MHKPIGRWRVTLWRLVRTLGVNALLPHVAFRVLTGVGVLEVIALCVIAVVPAGSVVLSWLRRRRLHAIGALALLGIALTLVATLVVHGPMLVLVKGSMVSAGVCVRCLVSLTGIGGLRQLVFYALRLLATSRDPSAAAHFEQRWQTPRFATGCG